MSAGKTIFAVAAVTLVVGAAVYFMRARAQGTSRQGPAKPSPIPVELLSIDVDIAEPVLRF